MKKITFACCAAAFLLLACNNGGSDYKTKSDSANSSGTKKEMAPMTMPDSATVMKNMMMYSTPGEMQKMMASWDGNWTTDISMWEKPGAPPAKSAGTTVNKMIMGGRYQESHHSSTMMGMPFEGMGTMGYDNAKKVFVNSWVDNFGSGIMNMSGPWEAATKSCTMTGKMIDPGTMTEKDYKETFKVIDDNTQSLEMFGPGYDGKEMKMMEIKFTRKK